MENCTSKNNNNNNNNSKNSNSSNKKSEGSKSGFQLPPHLQKELRVFLASLPHSPYSAEKTSTNQKQQQSNKNKSNDDGKAGAVASTPKTTEWMYNQEGEEEEIYGFKKQFYFNNDNFYSNYR